MAMEDVLPPGGRVHNRIAMRRLRRLVAYAHGARAVLSQLGELRRGLLDERQRCERGIRDLEASVARPGAFVIREHGDTHARVDRYAADLRRALERERERLRLIASEVDELEERERIEMPVRTAVSEFARALCSAAGFDHQEVAGQGLEPRAILTPGDRLRAELDELQLQLANVRTDLAAVRRGHLPRAELEQVVARELDHFRVGSRTDAVLARLRHPDVGAGAVFGENTDLRRVVAVLVDVLGVDVLAPRMVDAVIADEHYSAGLPAPERVVRIRELTQQLTQLAPAEEREAMRVEDEHDGCVVVRRPPAELDLPMILELWSAA
jgi:hypothetical protein